MVYLIRQAMWKQFYNTASGGDGGTLYQLRNLIKRRNVVKKHMDDLAACEDFAITVVEVHIVSAAMVIFDMKTADDSPCEKFFPTGCGYCAAEETFYVGYR